MLFIRLKRMVCYVIQTGFKSNSLVTSSTSKRAIFQHGFTTEYHDMSPNCSNAAITKPDIIQQTSETNSNKEARNTVIKNKQMEYNSTSALSANLSNFLILHETRLLHFIYRALVKQSILNISNCFDLITSKFYTIHNKPTYPIIFTCIFILSKSI